MSNKKNLQQATTLEIEKLSNLFKIIGDYTRLKILHLLMNGEYCVGHIAEAIDMQQSATSHQLRVLRDAHLVTSRKISKTVYYSLDDAHVETLIAQGLEHVKHS